MEPSEFNYELPTELIAQKAVVPKDSSRLMVVFSDSIEHKQFSDIVDYLSSGDVLVVNETKVSRAKICGRKITGSAAEIIICRDVSGDKRRFYCRIKSKKVNVGKRYSLAGSIHAEIVGEENELFLVEFNKEITEEIISKYFELPTPPYIKQKIENDSEYQTVYANPDKTGSLAAPTAGLHFTKELLSKIINKGVKIAKVCLHVDFGTFLPVRCRIEEYKMHVEKYEIDSECARIINERSGRLICVGTTTVRTLESASGDDGRIVAQKNKTDIFIYPGYKFKTKIDALVTNFHLPKSTLIMLVSAYFGKEKIMAAYSEAIGLRYRFFSLGDGMMLVKNKSE